MSFSMGKRESIKRYMLEKIREDDIQFVSKTSENFQISVTSVKRYINECIENKILEVSDKTATGYQLIKKKQVFSYSLSEQLCEDKIYYTDIKPFLEGVTPETEKIWSYAFMEMMNNAIEHSHGQKIGCQIVWDYLYTEISIVDDGIGIFKNILNYVLEDMGRTMDYQDVILELHKGKLTTNPSQHSGEGIFFSSKMLSKFGIWSEEVCFVTGALEMNQLIQSHLILYYTKLNHIGTMVVMRLENQSTRKLKEVFDMFAPVEEGFVKTYIPLKEVCPYGEPIARSQARRIVYRLEKFKQVEFDFDGVEFMGQGFADEIFRVFQNQHPEIELIPINANESVLGMINHVRVG